ncbi:hypothetical protein D3C79_872000 [compost metagenome]
MLNGIPLEAAKLPLMTEKSTSSRERGSCAASSNTSLMSCGFFTTSNSLALRGLIPSLRVSQPRSCSISKARAWLVGSLGMATVLPSFRALRSPNLPA